jgi:hypothetical protein
MNKKILVRIVGKKPGGRISKKNPTLYINIPWVIAQKLGLNLNDYLIMEVDEKAGKITLRKIELESISS